MEQALSAVIASLDARLAVAQRYGNRFESEATQAQILILQQERRGAREAALQRANITKFVPPPAPLVAKKATVKAAAAKKARKKAAKR